MYIHYINKFGLLLFISAILLTGCVTNSDKPTPIEPDPPVKLTYENVTGTWELYYSTRKINNFDPLRDPGADGSTQTFNGYDKSFVETNIDGVQDNYGTFEILGNDTIQYSYKKKDGVVLAVNDTITKKVIIKLTEKQLVRRTVEKDKGNTVEDILMYRNLATAPYETPDIDSKEIIDINRLMANKWAIASFRKVEQISGQAAVGENTDKYNGTYYSFYLKDGKYRFEERLSNDQLERTGTFRVVDDVIFLFEDNPPADEEGTPYFLLKDWGWREGEPESFINYSKLRDKDNVWKVVQTWVYMQRKK